MSLTEFVTSPAYKKFMAYVYGFGAAIAILGALFKILHLPGASIMLIAGLGVEAIIFALSSFEPPHEMPDWSLVYPELIGLESDPEKDVHARRSGSSSNNLVGGGSELSALLNAGAIEQKTIDELSMGVKKLANTTSQMADLSDAAVATKAYINNVKVASDSMNQMTAVQSTVVDASNKFSETYNKFNNTFAQQADESAQMTSNIKAVNEAYAKQLQTVTSQLESSKGLTNGLSSISAEIQASVEGVKEYRQQIASLSKTVGELNSIYGNMLSVVRK
ncbi:MAG: gliding motility protein GldL [Marinilabiliaceae bacterium]|nr:gliding motility protein GldL [Marinilabiliaceae bacterium]